ncbi:MAG: YARHG domain-containing protein, partial [bacterium]|nr:YARHG domain-containing protein [bacterium]
MKRIFIIVFLLCNSAIVYTQEDWLKTMNILDNKMPKELYYMRNEIYARHGKIFKTKELNEYFSDCSWYKPNPKFKENMFSVYEKETLNKIIRLEDELKPF